MQTNIVAHTLADGVHRRAHVPAFEDRVVQDADHSLVDDHIGPGGTLASLRGHIERNGGCVIGATTLTRRRNGSCFGLTAATLKNLRDQHGEQLERCGAGQFGCGLECLAELEAGYLLRAASIGAIGNRLAQAAEMAGR